jgi:hypothetical protein
LFAAIETGRGALPNLIQSADLRWLSALAVCGVLVVGLIASRSMPPRCQTRPIPIAFGTMVETRVAVPAQRACTITVSIGSAVISAVAVETEPEHGRLAPRGRTGVVYVPDADFKGEDSFVFALERSPDRGAATSLVRVIATVK